MNFHLGFLFLAVIFKVYDTDCNGKVSFNDVLDVLRDLTGQFISEQQREVKNYWKFKMLRDFYMFCAVILLQYRK